MKGGQPQGCPPFSFGANMQNKLALIDADTIIYQSAAVIQVSPLIVEHKISGRKKEFRNKTEWKNWLQSDKGRGYADDDFNVVQEPRLTEDISHALHLIKRQMEKITSKDWCSDFQIYLGGEGNYRKAVATMKEYKSGRPPKPLAFQQCYDYTVNKYKDRVVICNGEEAEDGVAKVAWPKYLAARAAKNKDLADVVICRVDKDLIQVPGWHYNYGKDTGPDWITDAEAARHFWWQMLKGDTTDAILGIPGVGGAKATKVLEGAKNEKECVERVIRAYKDHFEDGWESPFKENAILLRMRSYPGEMFDAVEYAKKLEVL